MSQTLTRQLGLTTESQQQEPRSSGLRLATKQEIAVCLDMAIRVYGPPQGWDQVTAEIYLEALAELPTDMLIKATQGHIRESKWFPRPAELRGRVQEMLAERRESVVPERKTMMLMPPEDRVDPEYAADQFAKLRQRLARHLSYQGRIEELPEATGNLRRVLAEAGQRPKIPAPGTPEFERENA